MMQRQGGEVAELSDHTLEVEQDLAFQYRDWRREKLAWIIIGLVLLAGLGGLFGHHPFARTTTQTANGHLHIEYDRYARYESSAEVKVTVTPEAKGAGTTSLWFDADYLDSINIVALSPWPLRGEARGRERAFVFQTDGTPFSAIFTVQFHRVGLVHGHAKVGDRDTLELTHLVWP